MEKKTFYMKMSDGHEVFVRTFYPTKSIRSYIHILHGMAEHSARYESFAKHLCEEGYVVSMHDHRGHGFTAQKNGQLGFLGYENGFERIVQDVFEVVETLKHEQNFNRPILLGHSLGSFIARRFSQKYSDAIEKLILSGTASPTPLERAGHILAKQLVRIQGATQPSPLMNDLSFGTFNRNIDHPKTKFDWLTTDEVEVQKYIDDPFCGFIATNQFFVDITGGMAFLDRPNENARIRSDLPILLISGTADPVGDKKGKGVVKAGQQLVAAGVESVLVYLFEGMRHEILNEKKKDQVIEIIVRWLNDEK
jgi:alpha-beta hydrolase superfamily lysophospholipase